MKKTISLPPELAREAESLAREEGKTLSGVVQDALRERRARRLETELHELQTRWRRIARARGILTQRDLDRLLGR